ncbi:MAG TPA: AAA family ATPase, partial [Roseiflexaceae bacterium]|nr:AAA family ATPase [Roseiflexaceae bacterium]
YSLGVMLYEILTGQLPFQAPTPSAMMFMHVNDPVPAIRATRPDLSEAVNAVIQKATAKRPADRYADVTTLMRDLRQALASGPAITRRLTDAPPSQPEADTRTTTGGTRSKYDTGLLYLSTDLLAPPVETPVENPYKGLRAFQEADADDFFGRDLLIQLLLARMQEPSPFSRFLAVVGPSGSGKSSVVRAGLVPAIRRGGLPGSHNWFVVEMFPGAHPVEELAQALLRVAVEPPNNLVEPLKLDEHGLLRVVDQVVPGADETEVVLIIDQFEEVFTLVEDEAVRTHFLKSLITAVTDPYSRIRVVVTLRADFYDRPLLYQGFSELMRQRTEVVVPLATEELKQAIISPAERNGLRVDPELVEAIVGDVGEQPGALPLLQYALTEVFERRNGRTLTLTPYNASGGVLGALARRAEEIYTGLSPLEQEAARQLFLRLVTLGEGVEDTRRRVRRTELAFINHRQQTVGGANNGFAPAVAEKATLDVVIEQYSQYRLLTADFDPATRVPTVEVAHEALIRTWTRLRQWLDASRDDLRLQRRMTMAAAEWAASGKDRSFLASGARLEQLSSWAEETHLALNAEERDYLAASLAERDAQQAQEQIRKAREVALERRSRVFLRALVSVFAVATVLALGLSVFAFGQRREAQQNFNTAATAEAQAKQNAVRAQDQESLAKQNAERAQEQELLAKQSADEARNLALASGAQAALVQDNLDESRSLALLAADQPNPPPFAEQMLSRAAYEPGARAVLRGHEDYVSSVAYSPDEKLIISGGRNDQQLILWDAATGKPLRYFRGHEDRLRSVLFLPDGQHVLSGSEDKTLKLWDINCSTPSAEICETPIRTFKSHTNEVRNVALRPNSNEFMSASADASLMLWSLDCTTPSPEECDQPIRVFAPGNGGHTQEANQVVFSADGKRALSVSLDTSLVLWEVDTGKVLRRYELPAGEGAEVRSVAFLPGETQALAGGDGRDINIWDLNSGQVIGKLSGHTGTIYYISVSPDGTR